MARQLRALSAGLTHPDERHIPADQRTGSQLVIRVLSEALKGQPVHELPLSEDAALKLAEQLLSAVNTKRRIARDELRRRQR